MSNRNYSIAIPIILTLFFFASLAGIIGNVITYTPNSVAKSFDVDNLAPNELVDSPLIVPDTYGNSEILVSFDIKQFAIDFEFNLSNIMLNFYFADDELPNEIANASEFETSSFFDNSVSFARRNVLPNSDILFFSTNSNDLIYLIIGNSGNNDISIRIDIEITNSDISSGENAAQIIAIVFSSIFTGLFFIASFYSWFEIVARNWYDPKVITDKLENSMDKVISKAESWELILSIVGIFLVISGYSSWLIINGGNNGLFIVGAIMIAFVIYNFNSRIKLHENVRNILSQHPNTTLDELSNLADESKDDLKKALLDMIIYENFAASFDFKTEEIEYDPNRQKITLPSYNETYEQSKFQVLTNEINSEEVSQEATSNRPLPTCAYCGEESLNHLAKFCHSCGASMTSAK